MSDSGIRILGIDTSLRATGYGVVEARGSRYRALAYGTLRVPQKELLSGCLNRIHAGIAEVIHGYPPEAAALEGVFFNRNARTSLILGEARGAAIVACSTNGLAVYEYAPRRVKQAVVGFGAASKSQVRDMIVSLLCLNRPPPEDACDALAIAICHLHTRTGNALLSPRPI